MSTSWFWLSPSPSAAVSTASDAPSGAKSTHSAPFVDSPRGMVRTGSPVFAFQRITIAPGPASAVASMVFWADVARQEIALACP